MIVACVTRRQVLSQADHEWPRAGNLEEDRVGAGLLDAAAIEIAWRSEPGPLSLVLVT